MQSQLTNVGFIPVYNSFMAQELYSGTLYCRRLWDKEKCPTLHLYSWECSIQWSMVFLSIVIHTRLHSKNVCMYVLYVAEILLLLCSLLGSLQVFCTAGGWSGVPSWAGHRAQGHQAWQPPPHSRGHCQNHRLWSSRGEVTHCSLVVLGEYSVHSCNYSAAVYTHSIICIESQTFWDESLRASHLQVAQWGVLGFLWKPAYWYVALHYYMYV